MASTNSKPHRRRSNDTTNSHCQLRYRDSMPLLSPVSMFASAIASYGSHARCDTVALLNPNPKLDLAQATTLPSPGTAATAVSHHIQRLCETCHRRVSSCPFLKTYDHVSLALDSLLPVGYRFRCPQSQACALHPTSLAAQHRPATLAIGHTRCSNPMMRRSGAHRHSFSASSPLSLDRRTGSAEAAASRPPFQLGQAETMNWPSSRVQATVSPVKAENTVSVDEGPLNCVVRR
jgi:hypothetical protein